MLNYRFAPHHSTKMHNVELKYVIGRVGNLAPIQATIAEGKFVQAINNRALSATQPLQISTIIVSIILFCSACVRFRFLLHSVERANWYFERTRLNG